MDRSQLLNDQESAMRIMLDGRQSKIWTCLPAIVTKVNLTAMTIEAQPAIQGVVTDENGTTQFVNLPLLVDVPIVFPSAGGFAFTLPIAVGNEVLILFSSRCIDAWWQSGGIQKPMEARMHDLSDGFAIPGIFSQPHVLTSVSTTGAQLRNTAGTTNIEIAADGKIKMLAPSGLEVTGDIRATGEITAHSAGTAIALTTHKHSGVSTGLSNSGGPVP